MQLRQKSRLFEVISFLVLLGLSFNTFAADKEYSLEADRAKLDELRKDIPPETRKDNDELALMLGMLTQGTKTPSEVRSDWQAMVRKKREKFNKDMNKKRDSFNKEEKKNREAFLKKQQEDRKDFQGDKHTSDERNDFFGEQDQKRRDYMEDQRDKRSEFESNFSEERKNFEDYVKEQNNTFNEQARNFDEQLREKRKLEREKKRIDEMKKKEALKKTSAAPAGDPSLMDEFNSIPATPGTRLDTNE